jgi:hypothetical protein
LTRHAFAIVSLMDWKSIRKVVWTSLLLCAAVHLVDLSALRRVRSSKIANEHSHPTLWAASGDYYSLDRLILFFAARKCKRPPALFKVVRRQLNHQPRM